MAEKLMIGWAEADVTPKMDKYVSLSGQYYARFSKEVYSRLKFTCAAFSQGKEQFVVGTLDIGEIVGPIHEAVGRLAAELEPAIDPSRIFINAIHTHTAPAAGEGVMAEDARVFVSPSRHEVAFFRILVRSRRCSGT